MFRDRLQPYNFGFEFKLPSVMDIGSRVLMWLAIKTAKSDIVLNFDCKCLMFKSTILVYLIPLENMTE